MPLKTSYVGHTFVFHKFLFRCGLHAFSMRGTVYPSNRPSHKFKFKIQTIYFLLSTSWNTVTMASTEGETELKLGSS